MAFNPQGSMTPGGGQMQFTGQAQPEAENRIKQLLDQQSRIQLAMQQWPSGPMNDHYRRQQVQIEHDLDVLFSQMSQAPSGWTSTNYDSGTISAPELGEDMAMQGILEQPIAPGHVMSQHYPQGMVNGYPGGAGGAGSMHAEMLYRQSMQHQQQQQQQYQLHHAQQSQQSQQQRMPSARHMDMGAVGGGAGGGPHTQQPGTGMHGSMAMDTPRQQQQQQHAAMMHPHAQAVGGFSRSSNPQQMQQQQQQALHHSSWGPASDGMSQSQQLHQQQMLMQQQQQQQQQQHHASSVYRAASSPGQTTRALPAVSPATGHIAKSHVSPQAGGSGGIASASSSPGLQLGQAIAALSRSAASTPSQETTLVDRLAAVEQRLSVTAKGLQSSSVKQLSSADATDLITKSMDDIVFALSKPENNAVLLPAANIVFHLSKADGARSVMGQSKTLMSAIIGALALTQTTEVVLKLSGAAHFLTQKYKAATTAYIHECGGTRVICSMLKFAIEGAIVYAVQILYILLTEVPASKKVVRECEAIQGLVYLLGRIRRDRLLALILDCLYHICMGDPDSKLMTMACNGPQEIVRVLQTNDYQKLVTTGMRVLKVLSICQHVKESIVKCGGMQVMAKHIHGEGKIKRNVLLTIRNLSDTAGKEPNMEPIIGSCLELLGDSDVTTVTCSVGILSNLTCNNPPNKNFLFMKSGIQSLLQLCSYCSPDNQKDIIERCLCTLRHMTNGFERAEHATQAFLVNDGHKLISRYMAPSSWYFTKHAAGLLDNIAAYHTNHAILCEDPDLLPRLAAVINMVKSSHDVKQDNISLREVHDMCMQCLKALVQNENNHQKLLSLDCMALLEEASHMDPHINAMENLTIGADPAPEPATQELNELFNLDGGADDYGDAASAVEPFGKKLTDEVGLALLSGNPAMAEDYLNLGGEDFDALHSGMANFTQSGGEQEKSSNRE
ncbi:catenin beta-like isoform X2 [Sycon ciliatum]|uniref:catenin beta-like isoform X2 n=1 Tax=Sycon ciliatum TaxID=27933 RepID=UPI0031F6D37F